MREAEAIVKQHLKKAKVNIVHKVTRQANKLENKRGNAEQLKKKERKLQRLQQQIALAKEIDLDELARSAVAAGPSADRVEELKVVLTLAFGDERLRKELLLSVPVQTALQQLKDKQDGVVRPKEKQSKKPVDKDAAVKRNTAAQSGERRAGPAEAKLQPEKHVALSSAKDLEESGDEGCASGDDDVSDISDGGEFEPTGSSDESDFAIPLASYFTLESGDGGIKSGGRGQKNRKSDKPVKKKEPKKNRNRLGQRARQKLAEEKFGQQALHIVEDRPANKPQKFGKHAKSDSDANRKQRRADSRQRGATKGAAAAKPKEDLSELHPSWAAKRQSKEKSANIQSFEGKRMTFSDSD